MKPINFCFVFVSLDVNQFFTRLFSVVSNFRITRLDVRCLLIEEEWKGEWTEEGKMGGWRVDGGRQDDG